MPERGPALIHDLGLALWVEVLGDLAHDTYDLSLPRLQQRRVLFDEIQQVFFWFLRKALGLRRHAILVGPRRQSAPQLIDLLLGIGFAPLPLGPLACKAFS